MRCFLLLLLVSSAGTGVGGQSAAMDVIKEGSDESSLDSIPSGPGGGPILVHVGFYIESMGGIKATAMAFDLDMYFRVSWKDERLRHNQSIVMLNQDSELKKLWLPDLYFGNAKTASFQKVLVPNTVFFVYEDGTVSYSARLILNVACNLDLFDYPLDSQICPVRIQSYAHPSDQMNVRWFSEDPLVYNPDIDLPEFKLMDMTATYCNGTFQYAKTEKKGMKTGEFSCLHANIGLRRNLGYHLVQSFIPTGLIVIISWIGFWIDAQAVPARISLSFTTLLTLSTQGAGLRYALPAVSYAKAIDFWYGTCMLFVFAALIEFAAVNSFMRRSKKLEEMANSATDLSTLMTPLNAIKAADDEGNGTAQQAQTMLGKEGGLNLGVNGLRRRAKLMAERASRVDILCRYIFPTAFLSFNIFYWFYYGHDRM